MKILIVLILVFALIPAAQAQAYRGKWDIKKICDREWADSEYDSNQTKKFIQMCREEQKKALNFIKKNKMNIDKISLQRCEDDVDRRGNYVEVVRCIKLRTKIKNHRAGDGVF